MTDLLPPDPSGWRQRVAAVRQSLPFASSPLGVAAALAAAAVAIGLAAMLLRTSPPAELTLPRAEPSSPPASPGSPGSPSRGENGLATVHAAGQVANPGVYVLPAGARVADVLTAAGGPLADADLAQLNLAAKVADGERVAVPKQGDAPAPAAAEGPGGAGGPGRGKPSSAPLDLNAATAEQLEELPGIGPATAAAILTWRTRNGRFRAVGDLLEVPGIGPVKLEAVRPLVRV